MKKPIDNDYCFCDKYRLQSADIHAGIDKNTTKQGMRKKAAPSTIKITEERRACYFSGVRALPDYRLEAAMAAGATICFDLRTRLGTVGFGRLRDEELYDF